MHPLYNIKCINHDFFSEENMKLYPERFVIVGFIAADGCIYDCNIGQKRLLFNIAASDVIVLDNINQLLANGERKLSYLNNTKSYMWYVSSNIICNDLARYLIVPRKTKILRLPNLSFINMTYYLRGYFYGDGNFYQKSKNSYLYSMSGNKLMMKDISNWLTSNGIIDNVYLYTSSHSKDSLDLKISTSESQKFSDFLFKDDKMLILPRKHIKLPNNSLDIKQKSRILDNQMQSMQPVSL